MRDLGLKALSILREVLDCESLCLPINSPNLSRAASPPRTRKDAPGMASLSLKGRSFSKEALKLVPRGRLSWRRIKSRVRHSRHRSYLPLLAPLQPWKKPSLSPGLAWDDRGQEAGGPFQGKQLTSIGHTPQPPAIVAGERLGCRVPSSAIFSTLTPSLPHTATMVRSKHAREW